MKDTAHILARVLQIKGELDQISADREAGRIENPAATLGRVMRLRIEADTLYWVLK